MACVCVCACVFFVSVAFVWLRHHWPRSMRERLCIGDSRVWNTRTETKFNAIFALIRVKVTLVLVWFALTIFCPFFWKMNMITLLSIIVRFFVYLKQHFSGTNKTYCHVSHKTGDDLMTQSSSAMSQGGRRKRTDLMPTIPIRLEGGFSGDRSPRSSMFTSGSTVSSSRGSVSRSTAGMSASMSRLDQLAQPRRTAPVLQPLHENASSSTSSASETSRRISKTHPSRSSNRSLHAAATSSTFSSSARVMSATAASTARRSMSKSMSHLVSAGSRNSRPTTNSSSSTLMSEAMPRMTRAERLRQRARQAGNGGCFLFAKKMKAKTKQNKNSPLCFCVRQLLISSYSS